MATPEMKKRPTVSRILILVLACLVVSGLFASHFWTRPGLVEVVAIPPEMKVSGTASAPVPAAHAASIPSASSPDAVPEEPIVPSRGPSFDIVRVGPEGRAVIAGQAQPGAEVVVRDGGGEVARARADSQGAFVALPAEPLKPGGRALTLASRSDGQAEVKGDGEVVLVVPQVSGPGPPPTAVVTPATAPSAVAVLVPDTGAPRVLQEAPGARGLASPGPTLDRVDYDDKGAIRFTGGAGPAATVRVYVDNLAVGDAAADSSGRWRLVPSIDVAAGMHSLRVDALGEGGRVVGRIELPFQRSVVSASEIAASGGRVVVQPGQNLWRLARAAYGRGVQYTVIYLANRDQIRDPRRIYPGQTFAVPSGGPASH